MRKVYIRGGSRALELAKEVEKRLTEMGLGGGVCCCCYYALVLFPAILSSVFGLTSQRDDHRLLIGEVQEAKQRVAQLETALEDVVQARDRYLEQCEKQIEDMEKTIQNLRSARSALKGESSAMDEKINALEEEVRVLWAQARRNNFDLHVLQSKAEEAEDRLQSLSSRVDTMSAIVSEQWIQIQQFEQALQLMEMRLLKVRRGVRPSRCTFLKVINDLSGGYFEKVVGFLNSQLYNEGSLARSCVSQTLTLLERFCSTVKEYHHELQFLIKQEMERHELTARIANEEVVFLVASALVVFPVLGAWMVLSSRSY